MPDQPPNNVPPAGGASNAALSVSGIPWNLLERMRPMFLEAGVSLPAGVEEKVPSVFLGGTVRDLGINIGDNLRGQNLYLQNQDVVTIEEGTGRTQLMTPERFVSWTEDFITFWKYDKQHAEKVQSMSPQTAKLVLVNGHFRAKLPVLRGVNMVKLPVLDKQGGVRLLPQGYDPESGIFTVRGGIDYPEDVPLDHAVERLKEMHLWFPWGDDGRSLAVHLTAMLTVFCAAMVKEGARVPMFLYNSNMVGSGKTQLAKMALLLVHGRGGVATLWDRNEEFKKELDSAAQALEPFLFFDDLGGYLKNNLLNGWLTSARWDGRIMGTRERFTVPLRGVTLATGNQLKLSEDLGRRTLIADLFATQTVQERQLPPDVQVITDDWVLSEDIRGPLLGCLYALVRDAFGTGEAKRLAALRVLRVLPSFEAWSRLVPPVVVAAGFADPLVQPVLPDAGSTDSTDRAKTVVKAIELFALPVFKKSVSVSLVDLCVAARRSGCFLGVLGTVEEMVRELDARRGAWPMYEEVKSGWVDDGLGGMVAGKEVERRAPETDEEREKVAERFMDKPTSISFGLRIRKALGMEFLCDGKRWVFGAREDAARSTFTLRRKEDEVTA